MKRLFFWLTLATFAICATSCNEQKKTDEEYTGLPLVILDTDMGSSTDDLFTLEMLHRYQDQGKCQLLGVVVDREGTDCAACADMMNTYFGHGSIPIGLVRDGIKNPKVYIDYRNLPNRTYQDSTLMFERTLSDYSSLPDGWQLYRQLLAAQPDHSVSIVSIGFVTCLAQLLESGADEFSELTGVELVRKKVKCLYIMAGIFSNSDEPDYNFLQGPEYAQTLFNLWPEEVDIMFSPMEVGNCIEYPSDTVIADIDWTDLHPIKQVYTTINCNTGQMMWDPMTLIQAVEGDSLFTISERGTVTLTSATNTIFNPSPTGNCRYQIPGDATWVASILGKIRTYNKIH